MSAALELLKASDRPPRGAPQWIRTPLPSHAGGLRRGAHPRAAHARRGGVDRQGRGARGLLRQPHIPRTPHQRPKAGLARGREALRAAPPRHPPHPPPCAGLSEVLGTFLGPRRPPKPQRCVLAGCGGAARARCGARSSAWATTRCGTRTHAAAAALPTGCTTGTLTLLFQLAIYLSIYLSICLCARVCVCVRGGAGARASCTPTSPPSHRTSSRRSRATRAVAVRSRSASVAAAAEGPGVGRGGEATAPLSRGLPPPLPRARPQTPHACCCCRCGCAPPPAPRCSLPPGRPPCVRERGSRGRGAGLLPLLDLWVAVQDYTQVRRPAVGRWGGGGGGVGVQARRGINATLVSSPPPFPTPQVSNRALLLPRAEALVERHLRPLLRRCGGSPETGDSGAPLADRGGGRCARRGRGRRRGGMQPTRSSPSPFDDAGGGGGPGGVTAATGNPRVPPSPRMRRPQQQPGGPGSCHCRCCCRPSPQRRSPRV